MIAIRPRGMVVALAALLACADQGFVPGAVRVFPTPFSADEAPAGAAIAPLPAVVTLDARRVALGERLFSDLRLSGDHKVACIGCHAFDRGGADGRSMSSLPGRERGIVNVPTIFNAAYNFRFAWSGRFADIGEQLDAAMESPSAMAGSWRAAAMAIAKDPSYVEAFAPVYPEGIAAASLRDAVASYSLALSTPNSRFDRFLRGELVLSASEQRGYALFREYGCVSCHQGINLGGNMFQRFGVMRDYFADRGNVMPADLGLFVATQREEDKFVFRVPSLRNVALTAPYFHDGSAATLEQAVGTMARYQLGRNLSPEQAGQIAAFLGTLNGELAGKAL